MENGIPEFYADGLQVGINPFTTVLAFIQQPLQVGTSPPTRVANVRMSLEHAKVMAIILRKQLKQFEQGMGNEIPLHPSLYTQLGISKQEDW
jgi:hypothetical protein